MGIGDYVHLKGQNYIKYGISQRSSSISAADAAGAAREELKSLVDSNVSAGSALELQNFLNDILNQRATKLGSLEIDQSQVENMMSQFAAIVEAKFPQFQAHLDNLSLSSMASFGGGAGANIGSGDGQKAVQVKTIKNTISQLQSIRNGIVNQINSGKGKVDVSSMQAMREQLNTQIRQLNGIISHKAGHGLVSIAGHEDLFQSIRETIKSIQGPTNKDLGDLGELFVAYMISAAAGILSDNIQNIISQLKNAIVGGQGQKTVLSGFGNGVSMSMLVQELNKGKDENIKSSNKNKNWVLSDGTIISAKSSQGTVDVSVDFPSDTQLQQLFGTNQLNASVKNYTKGIRNGIYILSGAPLLSLLMLVNTNFVNHYLNLIVQHDDGVNFSPGGMTDTLKEAIAVRALSGARGAVNNFKTSDMFIVNSGGVFRVITTEELFGKISQNINEYVEVTGLPTGNIPNNKVGGNYLNLSDAQIRITNLLATLNSFKISMSLRPNALMV